MDPNQQPASPQPAQQYQAPASDPGKIFGILSIIAPFVGFSVVGIVLAAIGMSKSKKAGASSTLSVVGLILSIIGTIVGMIILTLIIIGAAMLATQCADLGPGTHFVEGVRYVCS